MDKQPEGSKNITKVETKIAPITITSNPSSAPESPNTPTQITLAKAPTPWLQNRNKSQEELPEWAKRASVSKTAGGPSEGATSPTVYAQQNQQSQQSSPPIQFSPRYQCQQNSQPPPPSPQQQRQIIEPATSPRINPQTHQHERVIPIRVSISKIYNNTISSRDFETVVIFFYSVDTCSQIEDRPSVFDAKREPGHHQFKQSPTIHHQQRWGQVPAQNPPENRMYNRPHDQEQSQTRVTVPSPQSGKPDKQSTGTFIIPIMVEGSDRKAMPSNGSNATSKV